MRYLTCSVFLRSQHDHKPSEYCRCVVDYANVPVQTNRFPLESCKQNAPELACQHIHATRRVYSRTLAGKTGYTEEKRASGQRYHAKDTLDTTLWSSQQYYRGAVR